MNTNYIEEYYRLENIVNYNRESAFIDELDNLFIGYDFLKVPYFNLVNNIKKIQKNSQKAKLIIDRVTLYTTNTDVDTQLPLKINLSNDKQLSFDGDKQTINNFYINNDETKYKKMYNSKYIKSSNFDTSVQSYGNTFTINIFNSVDIGPYIIYNYQKDSRYYYCVFDKTFKENVIISGGEEVEITKPPGLLPSEEHLYNRFLVSNGIDAWFISYKRLSYLDITHVLQDILNFEFPPDSNLNRDYIIGYQIIDNVLICLVKLGQGGTNNYRLYHIGGKGIIYISKSFTIPGNIKPYIFDSVDLKTFYIYGTELIAAPSIFDKIVKIEIINNNIVSVSNPEDLPLIKQHIFKTNQKLCIFQKNDNTLENRYIYIFEWQIDGGNENFADMYDVKTQSFKGYSFFPIPKLNNNREDVKRFRDFIYYDTNDNRVFIYNLVTEKFIYYDTFNTNIKSITYIYDKNMQFSSFETQIVSATTGIPGQTTGMRLYLTNTKYENIRPDNIYKISNTYDNKIYEFDPESKEFNINFSLPNENDISELELIKLIVDFRIQYSKEQNQKEKPIKQDKRFKKKKNKKLRRIYNPLEQYKIPLDNKPAKVLLKNYITI